MLVDAHLAGVSAVNRWHVLPAQPETLPEHATALHIRELNVVAQPVLAPVEHGVHVPLVQLSH